MEGVVSILLLLETICYNSSQFQYWLLQMFICVNLFLQHYTVELKGNNIDLTEDGVAHAEIILGTDDLWDENDPWARCCSLFVFYVICTLLSDYNHFPVCNSINSQFCYWNAILDTTSAIEYTYVHKQRTESDVTVLLCNALVVLVAWWIWKHRNMCVCASPSLDIILSNVKDEARLWCMAGAKGLRSLWPWCSFSVLVKF